MINVKLRSQYKCDYTRSTTFIDVVLTAGEKLGERVEKFGDKVEKMGENMQKKKSDF